MKKAVIAACALVFCTTLASAQEMRLRHDADDASRGAVKVRPDAETRRAMDSYNMMNKKDKAPATPDVKKQPQMKHDAK